MSASPANPAEDRVHHPYSPSTLQSLEACPCYQSRSSEHVRTIIGTIAHKSTETRMDDNRLDDDDAAAAAECLDFYDNRKQAMISHCGPGITELLETYLAVDDCLFTDGDAVVKATTAGYVDRVVISPDKTVAELFDWKFGMWPIEQAENNLQGIAYVLGLFRAYPSLQTAKFFFKQPLLDSIQEATFTRDQIPVLYLRVQVVVANAREARRLMALNDWSKARPMVPACNFCANIGSCPAVAAFACSVGSKFFPLEIPENITPTMVHSKENTTLGLRLAQVLAVWAKSYRAVITDRVIRRDALPPDGYALTSRSEREVVDPAGYKKIARQYLTGKEYLATLDVSITKVEKKISEKAPRGQKTATVDEFKKKIEDAGVITHGQPYAFLKATANKPNQT